VDGKDGGVGFGGAWLDTPGTGNNGGEAFVYDSAGNIYSGTYDVGLPDWDGVVDNLPQSGGYAGMSGFDSGRMNSHRLLAQSAGELAGDDGVLWASVAVHYVDGFAKSGVGFALTDGGGFYERAKTLLDSSNGIGLGNGTTSLWGKHIDTLFWSEGAEVVGSKTNVSNISSTKDNVVVIKFEFGDTDTVSAWYFTEDQEMTEAAFIANALGSTSTIDENTLTTLAFSSARAKNALDEIRIGDTFLDVIGEKADPTAPDVDAGSDWISWSEEPVTLNDVEVTNNDLGAGDLTLTWSAIPVAGVSIGFSDIHVEEPIVTITKSTPDDSTVFVLLKLTVTQSGKEYVESSMTIEVYDDACKAAVGIGTTVIGSSDFNANCVTGLEDLARMVANWLVDFSLTGSVDK
jgi:hypothetical protein